SRTNPENHPMTEIFILATAHHRHSQWPFYSFEVLSKLISALKPQLLCVELDAEELKAGGSKAQPEYREAILPRAGQSRCPVMPIKPGAQQDFSVEEIGANPQTAIGKMRLSLFNYCLEQYIAPDYDQLAKTLEGFQSDRMDALMRKKWYYAKWLMPERWRVWQDWNRAMLEKIKAALAANEGKRILVTVGMEHKYWLRQRIGEFPQVRSIQYADFAARP
ncbi:MAG: hypothetical protein QME74_11865, partial [Candidatus Edwardsbacteria bacterium]|nr:hypothetical protein [Candidatus Edwardsbacteria bacterium]